MGLWPFYGMEYKRDAAFCQFKGDFHILYVFSASSDFSILAINLIIAAYIYLSLRFVSLKEHEVQTTQMMLPLIDSPILSGSYLKPILTQHSEIFSVLFEKP